MADFEAKLAAAYQPSDHPVWKAAHEAVDKAVADARTVIAEACRELGIPKAFAPTISAGWYDRGENVPKSAALSSDESLKPRSKRG
jgi:hypothetical protein